MSFASTTSLFACSRVLTFACFYDRIYYKVNTDSRGENKIEAQKTETKLVIVKTFVGINALARAVEFANMDLSYNKKLALADIAETQKGFGRYSQNNMQAFVVEGEKSLRVFYTFKCDIVLLNEYVPFLSMLTDSNFGIAQVKDSTLTISCQGEFTRECLRKMQTGMFQELDLYGYK